MKQKICTKCSEIKDILEFHRNKHTVDGRATHCKACLKKYYQINKERDCINSRKYYKEHGKELRKLPKKEKQFSVVDTIYQREHEKFYNEELIFIKREKWRSRRYDPIKRKRYYDAHKLTINANGRNYYKRNREEILSKMEAGRSMLAKRRGKRNERDRNRRKNMTPAARAEALKLRRTKYHLMKVKRR